MPAGRRPKITPELVAQLVKAVRAGNFREPAARSCGVSVRTLRNWLARGKQFPEGLYGELLHGLMEADAAAELEMIRRVRSAAKDDAKHAEWWLERKYPERWGRYRGELRDLEKR